MKNKFIGSWKLIEMYAVADDGSKIHPIGKQVEGLLIYLDNGYMSAQLGSLARNKFQNADYRFGQTEEIIEAFNGFISYFGTYKINEKQSYILHNIKQSLFPNWIGENVKRYFEFIDDKLILKAPILDYDGIKRVPTLVWQKI